MKRVLALLLCAAMLFAVTACGDEDQTPAPTNKPTTTTAAKGKIYAHNEVINRFLVSYMERHNGKDIDVDSLHRGEDLSVYIVNIGECQVTIRDVSNKPYSTGRYALQVEIVGGTDDKAVDRLMNAFALVALAADADCTADSTDNAASMLKKMSNAYTTRTRISDRVYIAHYTPIITEPDLQPCRISLWLLDDIVTATPLTTATTK